MRDKNAAKITIGGSRMVRTPQDLTPEVRFANFEELVRNAKVAGPDDRLKLVVALKTVGDLLGVTPKMTAREALFALEQVSHAYECNHAMRMALIEGTESVEDLVEAEEAKGADGPDGAEGNGSSEATEGQAAGPAVPAEEA